MPTLTFTPILQKTGRQIGYLNAMNLLYLSYWGINDGLTHSTIFPHLKILNGFENITSITFCTVERDGKKVDYAGPKSDKIHFHPLYSKNIKPAILNKVLDFIDMPNALADICRQQNIDKILARCAPAGALAWKVFEKTQTPFVVESFEPHSDYMLESGVWSSTNPKYLFEKHWEKKQKETAAALITVSHNYKQQLLQEGVAPEKVFTIPCCVDMDRFNFSSEARTAMRTRLGIADNMKVAVYVGKFGDIYYKEEAFAIIKSAFDFFGDSFFMIILSPQNKQEILDALAKVGVPIARVFVDCVPHQEIPNYLSAADFAISFVKPANCRKFCSPIKDGEYWAVGLPIFMTEDIGDDSDIVKANEFSGYIFNPDFSDLHKGFAHMQKITASGSHAETIDKNRAIAAAYRNFSIASRIYKTIFG